MFCKLWQRSGEDGGGGTPGRIRTCDLRLRRPTLYPTELRALTKIVLPPATRRPAGGGAGVGPPTPGQLSYGRHLRLPIVLREMG